MGLAGRVINDPRVNIRQGEAIVNPSKPWGGAQARNSKIRICEQEPRAEIRYVGCVESLDREQIFAFRKAERLRLLGIQRARSEEMVVAASATVCERLREILSPLPATTVGLYWPMPGELDLRPLMPWLAARGWQLALPVVVECGAPLVFRLYQLGQVLRQSDWGLWEPYDSPTLDPTMLLVPAVGFDAEYHRLGHGGGYYDRTLVSRPKVTSICIAYDDSELPTIYPLPHDVAVTCIVTERRIFRC